MISSLIALSLAPVMCAGAVAAAQPITQEAKELIVKISSVTVENNYQVEGENKSQGSEVKSTTNTKTTENLTKTQDTTKGDTYSSDRVFEELKNKLNEKFAPMFELKKELDAIREATDSKWQEYYTLNEAYNKQLKKIIAMWSFDSLTNDDVRPMPYRR